MTSRHGAFDVAALLESEREIPAVPAGLRARAVARARRAVVAGADVAPVPRRAARVSRPLAAAGVLVVAALAAATTARRRAPSAGAPTPAPVGLEAASRIAAPAPELTVFAAPPPPTAPRRPRRALALEEVYARELRLLLPARAALARADFAAALAATAAHERQFPRGQLAEEREALRIVALAGARRPSEARAAAAAFHARFPDSLLQRRVDDAVRGLP